jgi:Protein of unknown function, DUF481
VDIVLRIIRWSHHHKPLLNYRKFWLNNLTCGVLNNRRMHRFLLHFRLLASFTSFLFCSSAFAQFNDSTHYYVSDNSTGNINRTNAGNSTVLSEMLKFSVSKKTVAFNTINSYIYGTSAGIKTNSDFSSSVDFDYWRPKSKLYYWGLATFDKSYSLKINHRIQGGLGIGYTIVNNKNIAITASDGILYERSDLTDAELGRLNYHDFRNSFRLKYHWAITGIIALDGNGFWQPSLSDSHDVIWKNTSTLSFKIKKWLSLTTAVTYNQITVTHNENLLVTFGLVAEKYF